MIFEEGYELFFFPPRILNVHLKNTFCLSTRKITQGNRSFAAGGCQVGCVL